MSNEDVRPNPNDDAALGPLVVDPSSPGFWSRGRVVDLKDAHFGCSAFLVLGGPSLASMDLSPLRERGVFTLAVNNAWLMHRPNAWVCVDRPDRFADVGWRDPSILKFVPAEFARVLLRCLDESRGFVDAGLCAMDAPGALLYRRGDGFDHRAFLGGPLQWGPTARDSDSLGIIGRRSVMLVALALLHHLGFREVHLLGADFKMDEGRAYAWDETSDARVVSANRVLFDVLAERFEAMRVHLLDRGLKVYNCTPGSALEVFPRRGLVEAMESATNGCALPSRTDGWYGGQP